MEERKADKNRPWKSYTWYIYTCTCIYTAYRRPLRTAYESGKATLFILFFIYFFVLFCFVSCFFCLYYSLLSEYWGSWRMCICCVCHSPARWHSLHCARNAVYLRRRSCLYHSFATTELVSCLSFNGMENQRGHWVCWMSTGGKNGLMWTTHALYYRGTQQ